MAKLKINSMEMKPAELVEDEGKEARVKALVKELRPHLMGSIKQSVSKLSKDVVNLNNAINTVDSNLNSKIEAVSKKHKEAINVSAVKAISKIEDEVSDIEKNLNQRLNMLALSVESCKKNDSKVKEIIQPKIEQITVHKDHDAELKELNNKIEAIKESKEKIIEVRHNSKAQNRLNIILATGLILSIILHVI